MIPDVLLQAVLEDLRKIGDNTRLVQLQPVGGGCINHSACLITETDSYFLKWNPAPLHGMFEAEAYGLQLMDATHTVRVPRVLAVHAAGAGAPAYLLLEWLSGEAPIRSVSAQVVLGRQLAMMHKTKPNNGNFYGLERDNYIGSNSQKNDWGLDWVDFFRDQRLAFQVQMAEKRGLLNAGRRKKLDVLLARLETWLGRVKREPALLHGDLWAGNVVAAGDGLALIDPAVYYGDREAELAFTRLFGGFSTAFYEGYKETYPLEAGYAEREDLYNLYHLLNHLNLFGESYGGQVDA
ncbi:MAG: fructosamine kinase family protein, partial [Anaerolineae bacterium]|nr:fructosamine kinase family protein [Anaerolineae bacterium]